MTSLPRSTPANKFSSDNRDDEQAPGAAVAASTDPKPTLPPSAVRVALVSGRERSEAFTKLTDGRWVGTVSGSTISADRLARAFVAGALAILPVVTSTVVRPVAKPAPVRMVEPSDAGEFIPPSDADRREWSVVSMKAAPVGSYFVQGEGRRKHGKVHPMAEFYGNPFGTANGRPAGGQVSGPGRNGWKAEADRRLAKARRADQLAQLLAEIRPEGRPARNIEWDEYLSRAAVIERSYADVI